MEGLRVLATGDAASFWGGENVPRLIRVMIVPLCDYTKNY